MEEKTRFTLVIDSELLKAVKIKAVEEGVTASKVITDIIEREVRKEGKSYLS